MDGLDELEDVGGAIFIEDNESLDDVDAFDVQAFSSLEIIDNESLCIDGDFFDTYNNFDIKIEDNNDCN